MNATKTPAWSNAKCNVPMFGFGSPSGYCGDIAFGHQLPKAYLNQKRYMTAIPYCMGHACEKHGGPGAEEVRIFQDGYTDDGWQMWCAVFPDFINLQESPAGFDPNPMTAVTKLKAASAAKGA